MAAPLLYRTETIARMWTLLEANAAFTGIITEAREIQDNQEGWLKRMILRGVGDFPTLNIDMGDNFGGQGPSFYTFSNEGASPTGDWVETRTSDFKINIVYEEAGFDKQDTLEMAAIEALEAGGRNLGYDAIKLWGPWKAKRNATAVIGADETSRPTTQITIPVTYEFTGTQLQP